MALDLTDERVSFDDWEAGELAVEYDDREPDEVIEWALTTFAPSRRNPSGKFEIGNPPEITRAMPRATFIIPSVGMKG